MTLAWYYVYNPAKMTVQVHEVEAMRMMSSGLMQFVYHAGSATKYMYGDDKPGEAYSISRHLSTWLEERDDNLALEILRGPRLVRIQKLSEDVAKRLAKLQLERDAWIGREIEVIE